MEMKWTNQIEKASTFPDNVQTANWIRKLFLFSKCSTGLCVFSKTDSPVVINHNIFVKTKNLSEGFILPLFVQTYFKELLQK